MIFLLVAVSATLLLFVGMLLLARLGRRLALERAGTDADGTWQGIGVVDGAVFGLLGLIIALTFNGAVSRFEARRALVIDEANSIATAFRRVDILAADSRPALRESLRRYLDLRIEAYRSFPDLGEVRAALDASERIQQDIWQQAIASSSEGPPARTALLAQVLNQMFELAAKQRAAILMHPPMVVFAIMFVVALIASMLAGYAMATRGSRDRLRTLCFSTVTAFAFYVILDIEFPRLGLIRVDAADQALLDVRALMNR
jgi:hypothetical protein